jgi:methylthioribose-1-phosphate isomerase
VLILTGMNPEGNPVRIQHSHTGARAMNPAFDITPARLITSIITERGIYAPEALSLGQPRQT